MANDTGPSLSFMQKHFGPSFMSKKRKEDIYLPNESGKIDKRLKKARDEESPSQKLGSIFTRLSEVSEDTKSRTRKNAR